MNVGDIVIVRTGLNREFKATGNISSISKAKKRVGVTLASGITKAFYRSDDNTYIDSPGAGNFGHMLNDKFLVDEIRAGVQTKG